MHTISVSSGVYRQLFWSDWSADGGRIRSSTLLGEHIRTLVDRSLAQPTSLAVDYSAARYVRCPLSDLLTKLIHESSNHCCHLL